MSAISAPVPSPTKHDLECAPERPPIPFTFTSCIPLCMQALDQWVWWKWERRQGRWAKVLKSRCWIGEPGRSYRQVWDVASSTDPATWGTYESRANFVDWLDDFHPNIAGLGFVLADTDPYCVIDLDDCRDRNTGVVAEWALAIIARFDTYTEVSPSGTGVKLYFLGRKPGDRCRTKRVAGVEVYDRARYVAMTGNRLEGTPNAPQPRQEQLDAYYAELFPPDAAEPFRPEQPWNPSAHAPPSSLSLSDHELIEKAMSAANGHAFTGLWYGSSAGHDNDKSAADFALACHLAFWCGPDDQRIERLMWQSGLVRGKWDRADYLPRTIRRAIHSCRSHYGDGTWRPAHEVFQMGGQLPDVPAEALAPPSFKPAPDFLAPLHATGLSIFAMIFGKDLEAKQEAKKKPTTEEAAHNAMREARANWQRNPCHRYRSIILRHLATHEPRVQDMRCEKPQCLGCRCYLVERDTMFAHWRFSTVCRQLRYLVSTDEAWEATRKRISRASGNYLRVWSVQEQFWVVFTDADIAGHGVVPVAVEDAVETLTTYLHDYYEDGTQEGAPITTGHGWSQPEAPEEPQYERMGLVGARLSMREMREIAVEVGATVRLIRPHHDGRTLRVMRFDRAAGWDYDTAIDLARHLMSGEVLPELPAEAFTAEAFEVRGASSAPTPFDHMPVDVAPVYDPDDPFADAR